MHQDYERIRQHDFVAYEAVANSGMAVVFNAIGRHPGTSPELVLPPVNFAEFIQEILGEIRAEAALRSSAIELENSPPSVALPLLRLTLETPPSLRR